MIRTGRGNPKTPVLMYACSAATILAAGCPANAQMCPTGTDVPHQTIKIFNDSLQYVFAELEVGTNDPDQWIQMACKITQAQAQGKNPFTYKETLNNRFYVNGNKGIAPGGSVVITLPLYTQLAASVDPTQANQYAEWWQGENMQIFTSPTATPPPSFQNYFSGAARPNQKQLQSAAASPTWPTCTDQNNNSCLSPSSFFSDTATLPKYAPSQLVEATLGASQVQKVVNGSLPTFLYTTQADFDVSYVNVAYIAAAMGPYQNNQSGYVGSPIRPLGTAQNPGFRPVLQQFQKQSNWPTFIDLDGTKAAIPKLPSTLELMSRLTGANPPTDLTPVADPTNWPAVVWPAIQTLRDNWATYSNSNTCQHSAEGFTTFCDAILDVRDLLAANYTQYRAVFATKCSGTPVSNTLNRIVSHVYGWTPWSEGCPPTANLLENTPGYNNNDYALYGKVKLEFDKLNYGKYSDAPYNFNPWVQFIHGTAGNPGQLGIPGVYAYSVDDAVGNLNVEAQGYIVDIGSAQHLENKLPAVPPVNILMGGENQGVQFVKYGVCGTIRPSKSR